MKYPLCFYFGLLLLSLQIHAQTILIKTSAGNITVELYADKAPITVANFLRYVDAKKFDGSFFYRVVRADNQPKSPVKIEVIQGGFDNDTSKMFAPIRQETTLQTGIKHLNGTISMARDAPHTATSEFFICINNQPELDFGGKRNPDGQGFAAFGKVINGMSVVKKIQRSNTKTTSDGMNQYLSKPVVIKSIRRI